MILHDEIYTVYDVENILVSVNKDTVRLQGIEYYNIPCSFDIETSSFYENGEKKAIMYTWQFGIDGYVILGRTWSELDILFSKINNILLLDVEHRILICYVHNLSYEFQFLRKHLSWNNVFCVDRRKPVKAQSNNGILFKCSYLLSGCNLETVGNNLNKYNIKKAVGQLDYNKIRHSETPLTKEELEYCVNDIKVVMAYIQEQIEQCGSIIKIPLTKTGFVRRYCKSQVLYNGIKSHKDKEAVKYNRKIKKLFKNLTLEELEYKMLVRAFMGGFTHANPLHANMTIENVTSWDFTSSYPTVMIAEKFPMSKGKKVLVNNLEDFKKYLNCYCCLFTITLYNIKSKIDFEHYLSESKCIDLVNPIVENGRVVSADKLSVCITEQDFFIMQHCYTWDNNIQLSDNFYIYERGYLPTTFVKSILKLYIDKTELKDVKGKEIEYQLSKSMLNSAYGMTVTSIIKDNEKYDDDVGWYIEKTDITKALEKYNKGSGRFLFYPWGVWITAYARRNLWSGILACGEDYCYSDTDSIKIMNSDNHINFINAYNNDIIYKLQKALEYHNLDINLIKPKTIKGVEKPLGVWDYDGFYKRFKTLGAKRYIVQTDKDEFKITIAGLSKEQGSIYISEQENPFNFFKDNMYIPANETGKQTHTYIDEHMHGTVTDYLGNEYEYDELSGIHLEPCDFTLSLAEEYADYLLKLYEG